MFWWDKAADAEEGKIKLGWTNKWLSVDGSHKVVEVNNAADAPDWFWEMRDNTLLTKKNGLSYELTTAKPSKWIGATVTPFKDNIKEADKNALWRVEYCHLENKPNPEAANEGIPQDLKIKSFPDNWHKTGGVDYPEE